MDLEKLCTGFNNFVGDLAESIVKAENANTPADQIFVKRGLYSYNIKAAIFNGCTVAALGSIALGILGVMRPVPALIYTAASLMGRVFVEEAMKRTTLGTIQNIFNTTQFPLFKSFM